MRLCSGAGCVGKEHFETAKGCLWLQQFHVAHGPLGGSAFN